MKTRYKLLLLFILFLVSIFAVGWNFEPVKAAARKVVYTLRFTDGLVGYWSFNGADISGVTAIDRGSGGNNGTLTGGPTTIPGIVGQALNFDGVNDYVNVATNPLFEVSATLLSVSFWANIDASSFIGAVKLIFDDSTGNPGTGNGFYVAADDRGVANGLTPTKQLNAVIMTAGGLRLEGSDNAFDVGGGWHHYVVTYDGSSFAFYRDGAVLSSELSSLYQGTGNFTPRNDSMAIGAEDDASLFVTGYLDEARIYNRALTAAEIAYQYARTKPAGSGTVTKSIANNNGMVGFWDFDDCDTCTTVSDRSGNGSTGTMYNAAGPTEGDLHTASGRVGRGIYLDGSNDYVNIPNSTSLDITGDKVTIEAWINTPEAAPADYDRIVVKQVAGNVAPYTRYAFLREGGGTGKIGFAISTGGAGTDTFLVSTAAISINVWHHLVGVYDGAFMYLYVDGVLNNSTPKTGNIGSSATPLVIGADTESSIEYTNGYIDEVRVYNRAISAQEVKDHYNSTGKKFSVNMPQNNFIKDGLVGLWSFNGQDISGVTAIDRGSGGNNGTLTGGPTAIPGIVGQALNFDGTNDYVTIADHATLDITSAITISTWLKHTSNTFKDWESIVVKGDGTYRLHLCGNVVFCGASPLANAFQVTLTGTSEGAGLTSTVVPELNRWYHVATTYNGATLKIYIDGVLDAQLPSTGSISTNAFALGIGENPESTGRYWTGYIDEVRLYDRALSAAEVLQLYNSGKR